MCSEKAVFRPSDEAVFTTLGVNTHLFACEPSELETLVRSWKMLAANCELATQLTVS